MNAKWYIGSIILALAFFGMTLERNHVPNQEIVVQFSDVSVSAAETEKAISTVKDKLNSIGAEGIEITKSLNGTVTISYFSVRDVAVVQNFFADIENLGVDYSTSSSNHNNPLVPIDEDTYSYKLDVTEINEQGDSGLGSNGLAVEIKTVTDRFVNPFNLLGTTSVDFNLNNQFKSASLVIAIYEVLFVDTTSYKIPEVRAGPIS